MKPLSFFFKFFLCKLEYFQICLCPNNLVSKLNWLWLFHWRTWWLIKENRFPKKSTIDLSVRKNMNFLSNAKCQKTFCKEYMQLCWYPGPYCLKPRYEQNKSSRMTTHFCNTIIFNYNQAFERTFCITSSTLKWLKLPLCYLKVFGKVLSAIKNLLQLFCRGVLSKWFSSKCVWVRSTSWVLLRNWFPQKHSWQAFILPTELRRQFR